jgi:hypothetical protein
MKPSGKMEVSKFTVRKSRIGNVPYSMSVEFEGKGKLNRAIIDLNPKIAVPLARNLLSVAEDYVAESESAVA